MRTLLVIALAATSVLAGCGGGDRPLEQRQLSKREFVVRLNQIQQQAGPLFEDLAPAVRTPGTAKVRLADFDELIEDVDLLWPPDTWRAEHRTMLASLRELRDTLEVISRAGASRRAVIATQVARYDAAKRRYDDAVAQINATR